MAKSIHKRKEFHNQIVLKVSKCYILQRLMAFGKNLTSAGSDSRVHASNLLLCHDVLVTRDLQWKKFRCLAPSITCQVSDVDVSCHPYVRLSHVVH